MNVEELSMIGPDVDLTTVDAINKKRLLAFINHFLINTSLFLNNLSKSCEQGLMSLENKIQKLETSIIILESKLNSVSGLDVSSNEKENVETQHEKENVEAQHEKVNVETQQEKESIETQQEKENAVKSNGEEETKTEDTLNPAVMKYIRMVQVGVPLPAVKLKMEQEGIESSLQDAVVNYKK